MKIGETKNATKEEVFELLKKGFPYYYKEEFEREFMTENSDLKGCVHNFKFFFEKIGRKGSVLKIRDHCDGGIKANEGIFKITVEWDYTHPLDFCQNKRGLEREFEVII